MGRLMLDEEIHVLPDDQLLQMPVVASQSHKQTSER